MRRTAACLVFIIGLCGFASAPMAQCNENCPQRRTITTSGAAVVTVQADQAVVRATSKVYGADPASASLSGDQASKNIEQALLSAGVSKDQIDSTSLILQRTMIYDLQEFPMGSEERKQREFNASQDWAIYVNPDKAQDVLKALVASGAGEDSWVQWTVQDPGSFQDRASSMAVVNARAAARRIALKMNVHLGRLVSVNSAQNQLACAGVCGTAASAFGMGDATVTKGSYGMGNQPIAVNSRRIDFRVRVSASFAIEDASPARAR